MKTGKKKELTAVVLPRRDRDLPIRLESRCCVDAQELKVGVHVRLHLGVEEPVQGRRAVLHGEGFGRPAASMFAVDQGGKYGTGDGDGEGGQLFEGVGNGVGRTRRTGVRE